jgi:hypothetical protein
LKTLSRKHLIDLYLFREFSCDSWTAFDSNHETHEITRTKTRK